MNMEDDFIELDDCYTDGSGDDSCGNCGVMMSVDFNPDFFCRTCGAALCYDCLTRYGSSCSTCAAPFSIENSFVSIPGLE